VKPTGLPRGPVELDEYGNPIENVYVRKVERVNGALQNTVIATFPHVSQFWKYDPADYLRMPLYTRNTVPPPPALRSELAEAQDNGLQETAQPRAAVPHNQKPLR